MGPFNFSLIGINTFQCMLENFSINLQRCEPDEYRKRHQSGQRETVLTSNERAQLR